MTLVNTRELPILMQTNMVQALLEDRKTVTRRIRGKQLKLINENPDDWEFNWFDYQVGFCFNQLSTINDKTLKDRSFNQVVIKSPYGNAFSDDLLWVRETFYAYGYWMYVNGSWKFIDETPAHSEYKYTDNPPHTVTTSKDVAFAWYKRPSIFMPKQAARIWLKVKEVTIERLHDITDEDCLKEGVISKTKDYLNFDYSILWDGINGKNPNARWDHNPWVFRIAFEVISKNGDPYYYLLRPSTLKLMEEHTTPQHHEKRKRKNLD